MTSVVVEHLLDRVEPLVEQRHVEVDDAVALDGEVEERLHRAHAAPGGVGGERVLGAAVVAGRAVGEHEDHVAAPSIMRASCAVGDQRGPATAGRGWRPAARPGPASRSSRKAGARSHGVRLNSPNRMPMPRAVVCGRTMRALGVLLLRELDDLRVQVGPAVGLDEPVAHRPAGAAADLAHHGHLGAGSW